MTSKKIFRSTLAAVAAATMTVMATPGVALAVDNAPFVSNQDENGTVASAFAGDQPGDAALAKMPEKAVLKVHKFTPASKKGPDANGTEIADTNTSLPDAKPVDGVTFTMYKVGGIDLTTNAGWREATQRVLPAWKGMSRAEKEAAITAANPADRKIVWSDGTDSKEYTLTQVESGETENGGVFTSQEQDAGLYVVHETVKGKTVTIDNKVVPSGSIVKAAPFVVALPMTNPNKLGEWMKTVHVYPKNSETGIKKSVDDEGARGTGNSRTEDDPTDATKKKNIQQSTVTYTITADIPKSDSFRNFQVLDKFHEKVNYAGTDGTDKADTKTGVWLVKADGSDKIKLVKDTDYTVEMSAGAPANPDGTTNIPEVVVTLTKARLANLPDYKGGKLEWKLDAVIAGLDNPDTIPNDTWVIPDYPNGKTDSWTPGDNPPDTPNAKVVSKYGKMKLLKVDSKDGTVIKDVKFKLWVCDKGGNRLPLNGQPKAADNPIVPVSVNNETEFTTNDQGVIELVGLRLNNFKNGTSEKEGLITDPDLMDFYCLEETEAAAGYEKLPKLVQFQITTDDADFTKDVKVSNVPSNGGFELPLTGGNGIFPLVALGGLLVAGSAGYAAYAARRKQAQS